MSKKIQTESKSAGVDQPFFVGDEIEITIDSLSFNGGRGVGRHKGFVFFVSDTAPNEMVLARITKIKKRFGEAELIRIFNPASSRREPPCSVAIECGGCCWQHIDYQTQLIQKEQIVQTSLKRLQETQGFSIETIISSPGEFHYRNRIQVHKNNRHIGFLKKKSKELVPIKECLIADQRLTSEFKTILNSPIKKGRFEIAIDQNDEVVVLEGKRPAHLNLFSQVNTEQNIRMISLAIEKMKDLPDFESVLDLYCGSGNFTFPIKKAFSNVNITGVELSSASVKQARKTKINGSINFVAQDVAKFLEKHRPQSKTVVVLDPPRVGCDPLVISQLLRCKPDSIVYVSCNPATLNRDLEGLSEKYLITYLQPIDLFPQTEHVEVLTLLQLKSAEG